MVGAIFVDFGEIIEQWDIWILNGNYFLFLMRILLSYAVLMRRENSSENFEEGSACTGV